MKVKRISNELYHYGIKGQRRGVRRYQNKDGSLTAAGKARYLDPKSNSSGSSRDGEEPSRSDFGNYTPISGVSLSSGSSKDEDKTTEPSEYSEFGNFQNVGKRIKTQGEFRVEAEKRRENFFKNAVNDRRRYEETVKRNEKPYQEKKDEMDEDFNEESRKMDEDFNEESRKMDEDFNEESRKMKAEYDRAEAIARGKAVRAARSAKYKQEAIKSKVKHDIEVTEKKKLKNKAKLFGKSFKEVHTENINKGKSIVKGILGK